MVITRVKVEEEPRNTAKPTRPRNGKAYEYF
jgi:hypothetical protein